MLRVQSTNLIATHNTPHLGRARKLRDPKSNPPINRPLLAIEVPPPHLALLVSNDSPAIPILIAFSIRHPIRLHLEDMGPPVWKHQL